MIQAVMPSPNGKCAATADSTNRASRRRKADEGDDEQVPSAKAPRRSDQPSNSQTRKPTTPRSAQKSRKPKEDGVFDAIFNLMDSTRSDNRKHKSSSKSPPRDRQKSSASSDPNQPKFVSLQTRDDLMRHDSDNRMCYEFLKKEGLMERLLGHKMLKGRIEPYSYMGFVRKEPLHKPLPPEVFTSEFTQSCMHQKGPPGPRTPPGPGPQTPSGSPGHNSSGHSSPIELINGFDKNGIESPKRCMTPPPPPPILTDGGDEAEKDSMLREMSQLTDTPVHKLEAYFGKDLQNAMGKHDKKTLLAKLKGALKEMTHSDSEKEGNNGEETVAMDIASDASENSATIDDEEQRYVLSPLLLPPPPAPATPPPAPSSPPPPPPPLYTMQHQYTPAPGPAYQHYQAPAPLYTQPHVMPQRAPEYAPLQQLPPPMYAAPPLEPNYGHMPPMPPPNHHQLPPPQVNYGATMPPPPPSLHQSLPSQHLLPPPPPAPLQYAIPPPRPPVFNTSLPPPNLVSHNAQPQQVQNAPYAPPPVNLTCPPPAIPPMDVSMPPPSFSIGQPPLPMPPQSPMQPPPMMHAPGRFNEPPPTFNRRAPGQYQPLLCAPTNVNATPRSTNGVEPGTSNSTPVSTIRNTPRANSRVPRNRHSLNENNSKKAATETERRSNLERNVQELNSAVASQTAAQNPTEGNVMKTLWNALLLPPKEEKDQEMSSDPAPRIFNAETQNKEQHDAQAEIHVEEKTEPCESKVPSSTDDFTVGAISRKKKENECHKQGSQESVGFFDEEPCSSNEADQEEGEPEVHTIPRPRPLSSIPRPPGGFRNPHMPPSFFGNHPTPPHFRNRAIRPPLPPPNFHHRAPPYYGAPRRGMPRGFRPPPLWRGPLPNHQSRFF